MTQRAKRAVISLILAMTMLLTAQAAEVTSLIPIGHTVGIKMSAEGVLVVRLNEVQTANGAMCPARDAGVLEGDLIVSVNGTAIDSNETLQKQIALSAGQPVTIGVTRDGSSKTISATPCADENGGHRHLDLCRSRDRRVRFTGTRHLRK